MQRFWVFSVFAAVSICVTGAALASVRVSIDFEERPVADLSALSNSYHGRAKYIYAFLVVREENQLSGMRVTAYDVGYNLVCPDNSVVNHGFHRLDRWERLEPSGEGLSVEISGTGPRLPTAIGYWKLELKKGTRSRAELQIVPNPANNNTSVAVLDGAGNTIRIPHEGLSQDRHCFGLVNRAFYAGEPYVPQGNEPQNGEVVARFMPGVISMEGSQGGVTDIVDPGLKRIAQEYGNRRNFLFLI